MKFPRLIPLALLILGLAGCKQTHSIGSSAQPAPYGAGSSESTTTLRTLTARLFPAGPRSQPAPIPRSSRTSESTRRSRSPLGIPSRSSSTPGSSRSGSSPSPLAFAKRATEALSEPSLSGRYQLRGSAQNGYGLNLVDRSGRSRGSLDLGDDRPLKIKPGPGDSFLVVTRSGRVLRVGASSGRLTEGKPIPALPKGAVVDLVEGRDGTVHLVTKRGSLVQVHALRQGQWQPNPAVSNSMTSIESVQADPVTGELVFLGRVPGSARLAVVRSNASGSETSSFLLPSDVRNVNGIVSHDGQIYVASGRGDRGTLSTFGPDGTITASVASGQIDGLRLQTSGGKTTVQVTGADGQNTEIDPQKPLTSGLEEE